MADVTITNQLAELVARALAEDIGSRDITSEALVPSDAHGRAILIQKVPGIAFGLECAREAFAQSGAPHFFDKTTEGRWNDRVPLELAWIDGPARALLAAERVALNLLGHLSGVATLTASFVRAVEGTGTAILDTRKTTPGLRALEKRAVAIGGGQNHRMGLYDAVLIKENHIAFAGGIRTAIERARAAEPEAEIEIECSTLGDVSEALAVGAHRLLLDNMDPSTMSAAAALVRGGEDGAVELEASGGISLENARRVAETGVDAISVGALTHSAPALDVSMALEPRK